MRPYIHNADFRTVTKTKKISKKHDLHIVSVKNEKPATGSQKFKERKIVSTAEICKQNAIRKIGQIYMTCKNLRLTHSVFLMASRILKRLRNNDPLTIITGPQALACITLSIKYEEETKDSVKIVVQKTKIPISQVVGAQFFIFESLGHRLPVFDSYQTDIQQVINKWNTYIGLLSPLKQSHLLISSQEPPTSQLYRNYINLIIVEDTILSLICEEDSNYIPTLSLSLFFMATHSAKLIFTDLCFEDIMYKFCSRHLEQFDEREWVIRLTALKKMGIGARLKEVSMQDYVKIKGFKSARERML